MSGIFISYRRDEAGHAAGRLVDHLSRTFSPDQLFFDIDNIEPGLEFKKEISKRVEACDVLLALIGPKWLSTSDDRGARRLDNPNDFVRLEIETALARDIRVVPLLIDGARMPQPEDLPESLRPLLDRQHVELDHERFGSEVEKVIKALSKVVTPTALSKVVTPTKAEWRASLVKRENRYVKLRIETSGERPHWLELYGVGWMDLLSFRERCILDKKVLERSSSSITEVTFQIEPHPDLFTLSSNRSSFLDKITEIKLTMNNDVLFEKN